MELVDNTSLSDFTKKTLEQFGWKNGDPIPADLGQLMVTFRETLPPSKNHEVLVDATLLNDAQLQQIKDMLTAAKAVKKEQDKEEQAAKQREQLTANMSPEMRESMSKILAANPNLMPETQIVDDRQTQPTPAPVEEPPPVEAEKKTEPEPQPEPQSRAAPVRGEPFCPRCGWDMQQKFEIVPTDKDKEDFLVALLGGKRFKKQYELFGGKMIVTFRSMLAEENKAIYRQLVIDQQAKKIETEAEWFVQMMDYRLACSFDEITSNTGKVVSSLPEVQLVSPLPTSDVDNPLVQQLQKLNSDALGQEVMRRLVGSHLRRFQRLMEALEAQALEPSFWTGIE